MRMGKKKVLFILTVGFITENSRKNKKTVESLLIQEAKIP